MSNNLVELNGNFVITHRAVCKRGDFVGPERGNIEDAYRDARDHRSQPGNKTHVIEIFTEQTSIRRFMDVDD